MKIGDKVKNRKTGQYGRVEYSSFGGSVHCRCEETGALQKTLGTSFEELEKYWEVVENDEK